MLIGIWTLATAELYGPTTPITSGSDDERLHVRSALLLVVLAVDGMIERDELDGVAADAALLVDLVDCQLRTLEGGLAVGSRAARERAT